jgi:hypothetical protein
MAEVESSEPGPARHQPWALAAVGLLLMLVGYGLLSYTPTGAADAPDDPHLKRLREMAEKDPAQQSFAERLRELERQRRPDRLALLRPAGFIAFYAGLLLFIAAGIRMYRQPPAEKPREDENSENPDF